MDVASDDLDVAFRVFDADRSGSISLEEFSTCVNAFQAQGTGRAGKQNADGTIVGDEDALHSRLWSALGKRPEQRLTFTEFCRFVTAFRQDIHELEFSRYAHERGTFSAHHSNERSADFNVQLPSSTPLRCTL